MVKTEAGMEHGAVNAAPAAAVSGKASGDKEQKAGRKTQKTPRKLLPIQRYMLKKEEKYPGTTMYNIAGLIRFSREVTVPKLKSALTKAIRSQQVFSCVFHKNEEGKIRFRYAPELPIEIPVYEYAEEELYAAKTGLVKPFELYDSLLYRFRIYHTERNLYLFYDVHNALLDRASLVLLMRAAKKAYLGEKLEKHNYMKLVDRWSSAEVASQYKNAKKYFEDNYGGKDFSCYPKKDFDSEDNTADFLYISSRVDHSSLQAAVRSIRASKNAFFIAAVMMALREYNSTENIMITWTYNGREEKEERETAGNFRADFPICADLGKFQGKKLVREVYRQSRKAVEQRVYQHSQSLDEHMLCLRFQKDFYASKTDPFIREIEDAYVENKHAQNIIDVEVLDSGSEILLKIDYNTGRYEMDSMERFGRMIRKNAQSLLAEISGETGAKAQAAG